jgi:hypothetical protein
MTIQFTVYNGTTGAVIRTGSAMTEATARAQAGPGERVTLVGSDPVSDVMSVTPIGTEPTKLTRLPMKNASNVATAVNKTTMTANGTDAITISNVPSGATYAVEVPKDQGITAIPGGTITDGVLSITTTVAGIYSVTLKSGNFLDFVVNFNAA